MKAEILLAEEAKDCATEIANNANDEDLFIARTLGGSGDSMS